MRENRRFRQMFFDEVRDKILVLDDTLECYLARIQEELYSTIAVGSRLEIKAIEALYGPVVIWTHQEGSRYVRTYGTTTEGCSIRLLETGNRFDSILLDYKSTICATLIKEWAIPVLPVLPRLDNFGDACVLVIEQRQKEKKRAAKSAQKMTQATAIQTLHLKTYMKSFMSTNGVDALDLEALPVQLKEIVSYLKHHIRRTAKSITGKDLDDVERKVLTAFKQCLKSVSTPETFKRVTESLLQNHGRLRPSAVRRTFRSTRKPRIRSIPERTNATEAEISTALREDAIAETQHTREELRSYGGAIRDALSSLPSDALLSTVISCVASASNLSKKSVRKYFESRNIKEGTAEKIRRVTAALPKLTKASKENEARRTRTNAMAVFNTSALAKAMTQLHHKPTLDQSNVYETFRKDLEVVGAKPLYEAQYMDLGFTELRGFHRDPKHLIPEIDPINEMAFVELLEYMGGKDAASHPIKLQYHRICGNFAVCTEDLGCGRCMLYGGQVVKDIVGQMLDTQDGFFTDRYVVTAQKHANVQDCDLTIRTTKFTSGGNFLASCHPEGDDYKNVNCVMVIRRATGLYDVPCTHADEEDDHESIHAFLVLIKDVKKGEMLTWNYGGRYFKAQYKRRFATILEMQAAIKKGGVGKVQDTKRKRQRVEKNVGMKHTVRKKGRFSKARK